MQLPQSYYSSKILLSCLLVVALLPAAGCIGVLYLLLRRGTEVFQEATGWAFVIVFSLLLVGSLLLALKILRQLVSKAPRLTLTGSGITYQDYEATLGEIPWADIKDAYLRHTGRSLFLCLNLYATHKCLSKLPPAARLMNRPNKMLGFTPISFNLTTVATDANDVLATVKSLLARQP